MDKIRVVELFAGVGGFRLGLEGWNGYSASSRYTEPIDKRYEVVWSNQWEPSTKVQHASDIYIKNFGPHGHSNQDISKVSTSEIPDHDLLVGGFPCQDYSVAKTLKDAKGLKGRKGVLWWEIYRIVEAKRPSYLFLENVDRLLKSPIAERGRDFAIMLASLSDLGYAVEWRVINAADYGMPQRRRRVFILAYRKHSSIYKQLVKTNSAQEWIREAGVLASAFPVRLKESKHISEFELMGDPTVISNSFRESVLLQNSSVDLFGTRGSWIEESSPFQNSGLMFADDCRRFWTYRSEHSYEGPAINLRKVLVDSSMVPSSFYLNGNSDRWQYLKGSKREQRVNKGSGFEYTYNEGPMTFPDALDGPSRTIITGEGGPTPSRFKHVIAEPESGRLRRLVPVELERLNMFPDDHTAGVSDIKRAFFMGNALVVGIVERVGKELASRITSRKSYEI